MLTRSGDVPKCRRRLRRIRPGRTYLITKKCADDLFFLVPSENLNRILLYTLVLEAVRYGIIIHGFCFMSNHFHLVVTDPDANLPVFMRDFLSNSSKAVRVHLGARRAIWSRERYSNVELLDLDTAERKIAYTVLDPTRGELVEDPASWPGVTSAAWCFGETISVERPDVYFSKRYSPASVCIVLQPVASCYDSEDEEESERRIDQHVEAGVVEVRGTLKDRDRTFLGADQVLCTPRNVRGSQPARQLRPRFATRDRLLLSRAIEGDRIFAAEHERARRQYARGAPHAVFPDGTYGYRVLLGVRVPRSVAWAGRLERLLTEAEITSRKSQPRYQGALGE